LLLISYDINFLARISTTPYSDILLNKVKEPEKLNFNNSLPRWELKHYFREVKGRQNKLESCRGED